MFFFQYKIFNLWVEKKLLNSVIYDFRNLDTQNGLHLQREVQSYLSKTIVSTL